MLPLAKSLEEENASMWLVRSETLSYCRGVCSGEDNSCGTRLQEPFLFSPHWCACVSPVPASGPCSRCALGLVSKGNNWVLELIPEGFREVSWFNPAAGN